MNKKDLKIIYNKESTALSIEIGRGKSVNSDRQGNAVLDYDKNGKIVRINLYDFNFDAFKENQNSLKNFARQSKGAVAVR